MDIHNHYYSKNNKNLNIVVDNKIITKVENKIKNENKTPKQRLNIKYVYDMCLCLSKNISIRVRDQLKINYYVENMMMI